MSRGIILSGARPTGSLHLGNYFGALENWVKLQKDYDCYYFVADWHALTTGYEDTSDIKNNITQLVTDMLSVGLDPEKSTMFLQSSIREHAELYLLLGMTTPLSWLLRCPTYKDQINQLKEKDITTHGFLGYPCLQAADILMYKADFVPVGEDQLPHLELTREIARRFNFIYNEVFPEPKPLLTKAKILPGLDGRKMSKSYNNAIYISDTSEEIIAKVKTMVTDPARIRKDDIGHPDVCTVYAFHKIFNENEVEDISESCKKGQIGCVECKKKLYEKVVDFMAPINEKRNEILKKPEYIKQVIENGNKKASKKAAETMKEVRKAMKIDW